MEETTQTMPSETTESTEVAMTTETTTDATPETLYANKFKSVGELEKSYSELQSKFSKKLGAFEGAPESYTMSEDLGLSEEESATIAMLQEWGMENQMSNDGLNSLAAKYAEVQNTQREEQLNAEFEKLGEDAGARIDNIRGFLEANIGKEATVALASNTNTAAAIEAVEALMNLSKQAKPAVSTAEASHIDTEKAHEMRFAVDEHGNRKMNDPEYRRRVLKMEQGLR